MIIRCAWCQKDVGEKEPYEDKSITHTICPECKKKYFPELEEDKMYVVMTGTGSLVAWGSWLGELQHYLKEGETLPAVEYPPLKCKYCGAVVPADVLKRGAMGVETWASYHVKAHRDAVRELAAKKLPWSAGLVPAEEGASMLRAEVIMAGTRIRIRQGSSMAGLTGTVTRRYTLGGFENEWEIELDNGRREVMSEEAFDVLEEGSMLYHHSPISPLCQNVLKNLEEGKVKCYDFRGARQAVLCLAWKMLEDRKLPSLPVGEAWKVLRQKCSLD